MGFALLSPRAGNLLLNGSCFLFLSPIFLSKVFAKMTDFHLLYEFRESGLLLSQTLR